MNKKTLVMVALSLSVCAAIYGSEPLAASWTAANSMLRARSFFAAAELPNGNILVAGGFDNGVNLADSEIYNWHTGVWTRTASMKQARSAPVAVQLENGRVMVIGGLGETLSWMTPMNTPTFIDSTQVSGVIPFADLGQPPRTFSVFVYNPDGEDSNDVPFSVT